MTDPITQVQPPVTDPAGQPAPVVGVESLKAGWKTTEFWVTIISIIVGIIISTGLVDAEKVFSNITMIQAALGAFLAGVPAVAYIFARGKAKAPIAPMPVAPVAPVAPATIVVQTPPVAPPVVDTVGLTDKDRV